MRVVDECGLDMKLWEGGLQLLLFGIPKVAMSDALEKFFEGYQLAGHAFKHFHMWAVGDFSLKVYSRSSSMSSDETILCRHTSNIQMGF